jgi:putative membrane protein
MEPLNPAMKTLLRSYLINFGAIWVTTKLLPGLHYSGGIKTLLIGAIGLMIINFALVPLIKLMFLPLNLLTLGLFAWIVNVLAIYLLTTFVPAFKLFPYSFPGTSIGSVSIPAMELNVLMVAIVTSFLIGLISHFLQWLVSK